MTLPSSGTLTFTQIATEYRLPNGTPTPYSLSQYYRGGDRVPNSIYTSGIPTSSTIKYSDFYGTENRSTGSIIYTYTTENYYTFTVPTNVTTLTVTMWGGAGGSGGGDSSTTGAYGGGGGFAKAIIPVIEGNLIKIYVGQGGGGGGGGGGFAGSRKNDGGWIDGSNSGPHSGQNGQGGGGGGSSKIMLSSSILMVAQGGNGGGGGNNGTGGQGFGGIGGYNTHGKAGLNQNGSPGTGAVYVVGATSIDVQAGSGRVPGGTGDPDFPGGGVARGGNHTGAQNNGDAGGNGYVVISW